jgi:hypothetical protein
VQEKKRKGGGEDGGKGKKKAKKDANAPKAKLSAYMIFCKSEREKIKEEVRRVCPAPQPPASRRLRAHGGAQALG